jgi:hypothetical protein
MFDKLRYKTLRQKKPFLFFKAKLLFLMWINRVGNSDSYIDFVPS